MFSLHFPSEVTVTSALQEATRSVTGVCACPRGSCVTVDVCRRASPERSSSGGVSEQALNAARPLATCTPPHLHAGVIADAADLSALIASHLPFLLLPPQVCRLGSRRSWRPALTPPAAPTASSGASPSPASARCRSAALGEETFSEETWKPKFIDLHR